MKRVFWGWLLAFALPAGAQEWVLQLDPALTKVTFVLEATLHNAEGVIPLVHGEIHFDRSSGNASGEVILDARRATTNNNSRDKKMHAEVLDSERFPSIIFRPARLEVKQEEAKRATVRLGGTVVLHGSEHPLELEAAIRREGDRIVARSRIEVPYVAWGMRDPSVFVLRVAKVVQVEIYAVGTLMVAGGA